MLITKNKKRKYDKEYTSSKIRKRKRSGDKFKKMRADLDTQMAEKAVGLFYASGMNMENHSDAEGGGKRKKVANDSCKFCGASGHKTTRSSKCKYNGWGKEALNAEMVRVSISKASGVAVGISMAVESTKVQSEGKCELFGSRCDTTNMQSWQY
jgi:hypothetical protein